MGIWDKNFTVGGKQMGPGPGTGGENGLQMLQMPGWLSDVAARATGQKANSPIRPGMTQSPSGAYSLPGIQEPQVAQPNQAEHGQPGIQTPVQPTGQVGHPSATAYTMPPAGGAEAGVPTAPSGPISAGQKDYVWNPAEDKNVRMFQDRISNPSGYYHYTHQGEGQQEDVNMLAQYMGAMSGGNMHNSQGAYFRGMGEKAHAEGNPIEQATAFANAPLATQQVGLAMGGHDPSQAAGFAPPPLQPGIQIDPSNIGQFESSPEGRDFAQQYYSAIPKGQAAPPSMGQLGQLAGGIGQTQNPRVRAALHAKLQQTFRTPAAWKYAISEPYFGRNSADQQNFDLIDKHLHPY